MPITYRKDLERNYAHVEWIGDITRSILVAHTVAFFSDPFVLSSGRNLTDVRRAILKITGAELHDIILENVLPQLKGRRRRTAIVVQGNDQFGTARQYALMAEDYSTDAIFYDCAPALVWLLADTPVTKPR